jgi:hypothetical protein
VCLAAFEGGEFALGFQEAVRVRGWSRIDGRGHEFGDFAGQNRAAAIEAFELIAAPFYVFDVQLSGFRRPTA